MGSSAAEAQCAVSWHSRRLRCNLQLMMQMFEKSPPVKGDFEMLLLHGAGAGGYDRSGTDASS